MTRNRKMILKGLLSVLLISTLSGCLTTNNRHQEIDANHNGYIEYSEFKRKFFKKEVAIFAKKKNISKDHYVQWLFSQADSNKDGKVSAEEHMIYLGDG